MNEIIFYINNNGEKMTEKELEQVEDMLIEYWGEYYGKDRAKAFKEFLDDRDRKTAEQIFDELLELFPGRLQPLGTKKECMIYKAEALNLMNDLLLELKSKYLKGDEE